ncbi:MAG: hypothetical protein HN509_08475, partial [Halobacteriovoraceae bacterium]|nr:hypothetical protein [Halobacteriovoraceae bacterium]
DPANPGNNIVYQDKLAVGQIFSANEFKCCVGLGEETSGPTKCCTNFSVTDNNKQICKLPKGADLSVYFNRFVSGEGAGAEQPGGGLDDNDFIGETGEPKLSIDVNNKIVALGTAHCENGSVRKGSAFGFYFAEPNSGFYQQDGPIEESKFFSIIDSINDFDDDNDVGATTFIGGFRWNHHFYCD